MAPSLVRNPEYLRVRPGPTAAWTRSVDGSNQGLDRHVSRVIRHKVLGAHGADCFISGQPWCAYAGANILRAYDNLMAGVVDRVVMAPVYDNKCKRPYKTWTQQYSDLEVEHALDSFPAHKVVLDYSELFADSRLLPEQSSTGFSR